MAQLLLRARPRQEHAPYHPCLHLRSFWVCVL